MAEIFNDQRVRGVVVTDPKAIHNNQPVLGVRVVDPGTLIIDNQRVLGARLAESETIYNDQPVLGVVLVEPGVRMYNNRPVVPVVDLSGGIAWSPAELFAGGVDGFWSGWLHPGNGRMFTTAGGSVPVSTFGQTVGRLVAAAPAGISATQNTSSSRPTLARWPRGGRKNLLPYSELFGQTGWSRFGAGGTTMPVILANGMPGFRFTADNAREYVAYAIADLAAGTYTISAYGEGGDPGSSVRAVSAASGDAIITIGDFATHGRRSVTFEWGGGNMQVLVGVGVNTNASGSFAVSGLQVVAGSEPLPYQRTTTAYDVVEAGVPEMWCLQNDGGDSLNVVLPAGDYDVLCLAVDGSMSRDSIESDGETAVNVLLVNGLADLIIRAGEFSSEDVESVEAYWGSALAE